MDDYEQIRQLTARYNRSADEGDDELWLGCFAPDATFRRSNDTRDFTGHEELKQLVGRIPVHARHITTDFEIRVDGDRARQTCYLLFLDRADGFKVAMFGTYHDDLVRIEGEWRFARRYLEVDLGP